MKNESSPPPLFLLPFPGRFRDPRWKKNSFIFPLGYYIFNLSPDRPVSDLSKRREMSLVIFDV